MHSVGILVGFLAATVFLSAEPKSLWKNSTDAEGPEKDVYENKSIALQLYRDVRILCLIMTNPKNHKEKAVHVKRTWDPEIDSIALPVDEGQNNLWGKTKEAFKYIYKHHLDDADWFLKADDDTYVILENLRFLLYPYSPSFPIYMGCKFKQHVKQAYLGCGAGYVLSKVAVQKLVEEGISNKCKQSFGGADDFEIGRCLENVNVFAADFRDSGIRNTPENYLIPGYIEEYCWYWEYVFYDTEEGLNCRSDNAISYHYVHPDQMYVLDYLIYNMRPYGIVPHSQPLPEKLLLSDIAGVEEMSSTSESKHN